MVTNTKTQHTLLLSIIALMVTVGVALTIFSDVSPPANAHVSAAHTHTNMLVSDVQFDNIFEGKDEQEEPEKTIGPAIALGILGVGFGFGAFIIYRCRKGNTDPSPE